MTPERFQEIKAKVMKARAEREDVGYYPPFTDEDMTFIPFPLDELRESVRLRKQEKAVK